jgi:hypothetical protein
MKKIVLTLIILSILLQRVAFGYAYFDVIEFSSAEAISVGSWWYERTYFTGFETYNITSYGQNNNINLDGVLWNTTNVIRGNASEDAFFDTAGLRFRNTSRIETAESFYGIEEISFFIGNVRGGFFNIGTSTYNVSLSNDGVNFTSIFDGNAPTGSLSQVTVDVQSVLENGFLLNNGVTVNLESELFIRIEFTGAGLFTARFVNLDNVTIQYRNEGVQ